MNTEFKDEAADMSDTTKVRPSGAQHRKKKRAREEEDRQQRGALNLWIRKTEEEAEEQEEVGLQDDVPNVETGMDHSYETESTRCEHATTSAESQTFSVLPNDEDSWGKCNEDQEVVSKYLQRNDFRYLKKNQFQIS